MADVLTVRGGVLAGALTDLDAAPVEVRQWVGAELLYALRVLPCPGCERPIDVERMLARRAARTTTARGLLEEPTSRQLIDALDNLGEVDLRGAYEGELDALIEDVEALAQMKPAEMELTEGDLQQIARQAAAAVNALAPTPVTELLPRQPKRGAV